MKLALTVNGPGESSGWVRPVLSRLYDLDPTLDAHIFCVPDDYATGAEAQTLRAWFPQARVYEPREYVRFALGQSLDGVPDHVDLVQYFGGDLMHAARLQRRLGGKLATFKFSRPRYARRTTLACAVDERNAGELRAWGLPQEAVHVVGNPAIDAAFDESLRGAADDPPDGGIVILPGSRSYEVEQLIPFFFTMAVKIAREQSDLPITLAISPFTSLDAVAQAIAQGGDERMFSEKGELVQDGTQVTLVSQDHKTRVPVVRNAMRAAARARIAVTIPGTKVIELAALGVPTLSITPLNIPDKITINGALTYVDRIPFFGKKIKAAAVLTVAKRFPFFTQPNIDANEELVRELRGTLTPGRVARITLDLLRDEPWQLMISQRLRELYLGHRGAAARMATLMKGEA